jgi:hypothetical protein
MAATAEGLSTVHIGSSSGLGAVYFAAAAAAIDLDNSAAGVCENFGWSHGG